MIPNTWVKDKKLTKANSHMAGDAIFYIAKKDNKERAASLFWAYLYPQGVVIRGEDTKPKLKEWLDANIEKIENRIKVVGLC